MTEVVAALIRRNNKILICRRPANKKRALLWEFVGGKPEPGETLTQALARECREELDIELEIGEKFAECTHEYPDMTVHLTVFEAAIAKRRVDVGGSGSADDGTTIDAIGSATAGGSADDGEPKLLEHADMRWVTADELDLYEFCPADAAILAKLKAGE